MRFVLGIQRFLPQRVEQVMCGIQIQLYRVK
jgi:hypothetical protein